MEILTIGIIVFIAYVIYSVKEKKPSLASNQNSSVADTSSINKTAEKGAKAYKTRFDKAYKKYGNMNWFSDWLAFNIRLSIVFSELGIWGAGGLGVYFITINRYDGTAAAALFALLMWHTYKKSKAEKYFYDEVIKFNVAAALFETEKQKQDYTATTTTTKPKPAIDDAHFMTTEQVGAAGLLTGAGIPLGQTIDGQPIHYKDGLHLLTIAPSGSWKHAAVQGNVLIEYDAPIVIIDPKGENAIVTAQNRRDNLGHEVHILNPFGVLEEQFTAQGFTSSRFNPLAALSPSNPNFVADVAALGESLILTEGKEPFFDDTARELVKTLIMYVCTVPDEVATLPRVREILTSQKQLKGVLLDAESSDYKPLAQMAGAFIEDRKAADLGINKSVLSSAKTQTSFINDDRLAENLSDSDFRFLDLKQKKITVYIVLPAKMLFTYKRWFRLLVTAGLDDLMSTEEKGKKPVLFMLDEAPILGHLSSIETAFGLSRGFGVQVWPFFQNLGQLNKIYGKDGAETFFSNSGVHQFFTPNGNETAEYISERCGEVTSYATSTSYGQHLGTTEGQRKERLYSTHNLRSMPKDEQLLFIENHSNGIKAAKVRYFKNSKYNRRFMANPYV